MELDVDELFFCSVVGQVEALNILGAVVQGLVLLVYMFFQRVGDRVEGYFSDLDFVRKLFRCGCVSVAVS